MCCFFSSLKFDIDLLFMLTKCSCLNLVLETRKRLKKYCVDLLLSTNPGIHVFKP